MSKKLSTQHSKFCLLMAGGNINQTMAYMECYPDCTYESARRDASRLLTNVDLKAEVNRLQNLTISEKTMNRTYKQERLKEIAEGTVDETKVSDMTKAIDIDNRMSGHYEPDLVEHNINITWGEGK